MRIAVISDIHSNMDGFTAVLDDISHMHADRIISLGDNIGYGPEPEAVVRTLMEQKIPSVMGNHERALVDPQVERGFNPQARKALKINKALLSMDSMGWISRLPACFRIETGRFMHGVAPDGISGYISRQSPVVLKHLLDKSLDPVSFVGHTHELAVYKSGREGVTCKKFWKKRVFLAKTSKYIINSGSVGQPRDSHNKATYVIWDPDTGVVESRAVPYDTDRTVRLIRRAGIPQVYAGLLLPGGSGYQINP